MVHGSLSLKPCKLEPSSRSLTPRHLTAKVTRSPEALKQGGTSLQAQQMLMNARLTGSACCIERERHHEKHPHGTTCRLRGISEIMLVTRCTAKPSTASAACIACSCRHARDQRDMPCWHGAKAISQVWRRCREEHRTRREDFLQSVPFRRRNCRST